MKPILFLNDEPKTVRLMSGEVTFAGVALRESQARAGCNCDRWGHPCARCLDTKNQMKADAPISSPVKQRGK